MMSVKVEGMSLFSIAFLILASGSMGCPLEVGFYRHTCPSAESIVRQTVSDAVAKDPGLLPALIRLHFHDCFVRGCDASILLDSTPDNRAEKESRVNNPSLRGYDLIDAAKTSLECACPGTVSCADIIAFAARDSVNISSSGKITYSVPAGRRDGRNSVEADVIQNLPAPTFNAEQLTSNFANKGLTLDEMVTLSGAHSTGVAHCSTFAADRLYNSTDLSNIDSAFAEQLKGQCPRRDNVCACDLTVVLDIQTPEKLDNEYYLNLVKKRGVLGSDQTLWTSQSTAGFVARNAKDAEGWAAKFATAMVRMGGIEVMTGEQGEVRERCRVIN